MSSTNQDRDNICPLIHINEIHEAILKLCFNFVLLIAEGNTYLVSYMVKRDICFKMLKFKNNFNVNVKRLFSAHNCLPVISDTIEVLTQLLAYSHQIR